MENAEQESYKQIDEPKYWISYEYEQIRTEIIKLNEKMDTILSLLQAKPRRTTLAQVDAKMDDLIETVKK